MPDASLPDILARSPVRVIFGSDAIDQLGQTAKTEGASRVLLVTDPGIVAAGHADRAIDSLRAAGVGITVFDGVRENPTTEHVAAGLELARLSEIDFIIGLGGGSAMDCAKGVNLLLTNGGEIADYWGVDKTTASMLPMIAVPTTAGTGSEAQSFALITDPVTHQKMACGDRRPPAEGGLRPRVAILDPHLTASAPPIVTAAAGIDAIAHAVETAASIKCNETSREFSRLAWALLDRGYPRVVHDPQDADARSDMLLGAHLAGCAIERSMLGAAHACANPLTAKFGTTHGIAVGLMLPAVVRFNTAAGQNPYADIDPDPQRLAATIEAHLAAAHLPTRLSQLDVPPDALPALAQSAAEQWTANFNPTPVGPDDLARIYENRF